MSGDKCDVVDCELLCAFLILAKLTDRFVNSRPEKFSLWGRVLCGFVRLLHYPDRVARELERRSVADRAAA